jgi:hypothetical protein
MSPAVPNIIAPRPGVSSVVLTSAGHYNLAPRLTGSSPMEGSLGLRTIASALSAQGFDRTSILLPSPKGPLDIERDQAKIVDAFRGKGAAEEGAVIGISVLSEHYYLFRPLSRLLAKAFPGAQIVAGGPHFARERVEEGFADSVELALRDGLAHAIQAGRSDTFTDFVVRHGGRRDEVEGPGFYRLDDSTNEVVGHGVGRHPRLGRLPYDIIESHMGVRVLLGDTCSNRCDFCSAPKSSRPFYGVPQIVRDLVQIFKAHVTGALLLYDPNPIDRRRFDFYDEVFLASDAFAQRTIKGIYIDPASLIATDHYERVLRMVQRSVVWHMFAGRETVLEKSARAVGTRFEGRPKDQAMLDAEREALTRFIVASKGFHRRLARGMPREFTVSYMVSPFDTRESAMAIYDDIRHFLALEDASTRIKFNMCPLMPYPGTKLRRRYRRLIEMERMNFQSDTGDSLTPWKRDAGPGSVLMRNVAMLPEHGDMLQEALDFKDAVEESF